MYENNNKSISNFNENSELINKYGIIEVKKDSNLFLLLTKMQNEVHNYTISYHKNIRSTNAITSVLDNISGIGLKRKKELLKKYKTISNIKNASIDELAKILPKNIAISLHNSLEKININ